MSPCQIRLATLRWLFAAFCERWFPSRKAAGYFMSLNVCDHRSI